MGRSWKSPSLVVNYREYFNPQVFMAAMAGARF